ncbi:MAG: EF-P lysine aminoacylase EpmA [Myxococcaceae bacterium]
MPSEAQWRAARARQAMYGALRQWFGAAGYLEVETPTLVPTPGLEPHIDPFETTYVPQTGVGTKRPLWLHTSPEYAMKRLLADPGCPPLFQICKTYRNGEISGTHNPEFTMLEFYRPNADYSAIMSDLEQALAAVEQAVAPKRGLFSQLPFERLTVADAVKRHTGVELYAHPDAAAFRRAVEATGVVVSPGSTSFDDVFFHLFLERVERQLGKGRPTFLCEYPASMAALSKVKASDPRVAERVELYADGVELANGFTELTDADEQRRRLVEEQELRRSLGRPVFPLDEKFLAALPKLPPSGGIAVGLDRVLMLLLGAGSIEEVVLFPAREF